MLHIRKLFARSISAVIEIFHERRKTFVVKAIKSFSKNRRIDYFTPLEMLFFWENRLHRKSFNFNDYKLCYYKKEIKNIVFFLIDQVFAATFYL